ncbi:LysR family transcriptional regulator [uncultured Xylophilus sp.]|uniref:LysR family transcriptional regulator n=1 Tax=uncultured Xylophilus sp. TaxID=296832 RepID=UPI0025DDECF9|nr:LysR family transcriptional regulator [uncultured Xylophilus sp.]
MNITFKQLEAFFFSAKSGSFSAAAVLLHTTQSAMSKRVAEVESACGTPLLHRTPRGLELTHAGRQLMPMAEESQRLLARIQQEIGTDRTLRGSLRIGVTELIALTWLTHFVQRMQRDHPGLMLEPVVDAGLKLFDGLEANRLDLAIMPGTFWGKGYTTVRVGQVEDLWVASPKLKLPRRALKPHEFAAYPMLEQSTGAAKNRFYAAWRAEHGFRFNQVFATNSTTVLRELTIGGLGISQLALDYVRDDIDAGRLRIVRSDPMPPPMVYGAVYRSDGFNPALARVADLAAELCDFSLRANQNVRAPAARRRRKATA